MNGFPMGGLQLAELLGTALVVWFVWLLLGVAADALRRRGGER